MIEKDIFVLFIFLHDKITTLPEKIKEIKNMHLYGLWYFHCVFFFTSFMEGNLIFLHRLNVILV
jgi:hypothetical protein